MLFCFKDLQWEKIALVITKTNNWNSERSVQFLNQNNFLTCSCTFEQLIFKLDKHWDLKTYKKSWYSVKSFELKSSDQRTFKEKNYNTSVLYLSLEILRFLNFFTRLLSSFLSSKKSYILFINSNLSFAEYKTFIWWIRIFHVYQKIEAWKYLVKS